MARTTYVSVSIRGPGLEEVGRTIELGEFKAVWWPDGVTIGSDSRCNVVLPQLPAVAARVAAASNHKLLYRLPSGTSLPLPPVAFPLDPYDQRVDYSTFELGPYAIHFGEIVRED